MSLDRFAQVYDEHLDFVWRTMRRLGIAESGMEDAVQDVFVVVHRKLATFEARSSMKTWLFGIADGVARNHRRTARRKRTDGTARSELGPDDLPDSKQSPFQRTADREGLGLVQSFLDSLDDDKRAVFILAELEQMPAPAIAEAVGTNVNTVYSRLRAARALLEAAVERQAAIDARSAMVGRAG
jgi:RNA polymerase sigma-70 factor (ECF subfamily)